jgi:hypothetical protein
MVEHARWRLFKKSVSLAPECPEEGASERPHLQSASRAISHTHAGPRRPEAPACLKLPLTTAAGCRVEMAD